MTRINVVVRLQLQNREYGRRLTANYALPEDYITPPVSSTRKEIVNPICFRIDFFGHWLKAGILAGFETRKTQRFGIAILCVSPRTTNVPPRLPFRRHLGRQENVTSSCASGGVNGRAGNVELFLGV